CPYSCTFCGIDVTHGKVPALKGQVKTLASLLFHGWVLFLAGGGFCQAKK
ncbi:MAG: hypothetical protein IH901_02665, partial [Proteobacteria bacterium]|nr:hypothetical protein [Pseudomonadota bacterium]